MLHLEGTKTIELKVRTENDTLGGWEDRKVEATFQVAPNEKHTLMVVGSSPELRLSEAAVALAKALYPDVVECRWNFQGSLQGHYQFC